MKYTLFPTSRFAKDVKRLKKSGCNIDRLKRIIEMLAKGQKLPVQYRDHKLKGNWEGVKECHIAPDWLLIYKIEGESLVLVRIVSHSSLDLA